MSKSDASKKLSKKQMKAARGGGVGCVDNSGCSAGYECINGLCYWVAGGGGRSIR